MILITGASSPLGREISLALARKKFSLLLHYYRNEKIITSLIKECEKEGIKAEPQQGDFFTLRGVKEFLFECKKKFVISGLINNIGIFFLGSLKATKNQTWLDLFQLNLITPIFLTQEVLPSIRENKGSIVNLGVIGLGKFDRKTPMQAYHITKEALRSYTILLAKEEHEHGVNVNMVSPGILESDMRTYSEVSLRKISLSNCAEIIADFFTPHYKNVTGQNIELLGVR